MEAMKVLFESSDSMIYYSDNGEYETPVIVKVLKREAPEPLKLQQFYNEYEITKNLHLEGIRKAYDSKNINGKPAIILEYIEGQSIKELLTRGKFKIQEFLALAIRIVDVLNGIHEHNIIHKDINSKNIIVGKQRNQVYLIDFGISSKISLKSHQMVNPDQLEGTLAYLSPEQTGRMNRFVDYRTDFYSLGITFYEMLSGKVPFQGDDPVELVHSHIAKNPESLHALDHEIPEVISAIISKLLSKNAEDRYQSAAGIKYDLQKCLDQLEKNAKVTYFQLGENDYSSRFQIPQKLYGREHDIESLMQAFEKVSNGSNEMVIISGYSGVGKTALVHEIYKPVTEKHGYFIEGKFDQFQRNTPYFSFLQAFTTFFSQLLTESSERLQIWKDRFQEAVGDYGKILTEVIPRLELIIGKQSEVEKVGTVEAQHRFNYIFINFLNCIATKSHPLVIFIDDLQWADSGSLNLIRQIMTEDSVQYLLLITAYRDNEVDSSHPWITTINEIREANPNISRIFLKGLDVQHVNQMVAETLNTTEINGAELSKLIYRKTEGNPFFINAFLKNLHSNNMILWDATGNSWRWHLEEIRAMDVTDNVIHFLANKMQTLSHDAYQLLQYASCMGSRFSIKLLGAVFHYEPAKVNQLLYEAMEEGYVVPFFVDKKATDADGNSDILNITYKFTHDRVQQAVYSKITEKQQADIHYQIGNYLLNNADTNAEIFRITDHLNNARRLMARENEIDRLAHLNYEAGLKAKDNNAHEAALSYYEHCIALLPESYWATDFDFIFSAMLETAEERFINHHEADAEELIETILAHVRSPIERAMVLEKKVILFTVLGRLPEALVEARKALGYLGIRIPKGKVSKLAGIGFQLVKANAKMRNRKAAEIVNLPEVNTIKDKLIVRIIYNMLTFLYYLDQEIFIFLALFMANHSLRKGNSIVSPIAFVSLGIVNAAFFQRYRKAYDLAELSFKLNEKYYNGAVKGRLILNFTGGIRQWVKPVREQIDLLYSGYKLCMESGDLPYAGDTVNVTFSMQFYCGKNLHALLEEFEDFRPFINRINDHKQQQDFLAHYAIAQDLVAPKENKEDVAAFDKNFIAANDNRFTLGYFYCYRALYYLLTGNPAKSLEYTTAGWKNMEGVRASIVEALEVFYHALSLAANYDDATPAQQRPMHHMLHKCLAQYKKWAASCEANYGHAAALIEGEIARINRDPHAAGFYHKAIELARENKLVHMEALAHELLSKFMLRQGLTEAAFVYLREAASLYDRWGATLKVNLLKETLQKLFPGSSYTAIASPEDSFHHSTTRSSDLIDMMSVLKSSTAISGEIRIERMLDVLMKIVLENAGAQRGYFILVEESKYLFKSVEAVDEGEIKELPALISDMMPDSVIQYVSRTRESVVLMDSVKDARFASDPYIQNNKPKSVLCAPIISKGKIIALLYLENNLVNGAFGPNRLELLKILSGQIAVSLENSLLYENLELKVKERTIEIVKQKEMVEAEKQKSDELLQNILPAETAAELKANGSARPRRFENVTVMFTDFVNFTGTSEALTADALVEEINYYYSGFDEIITRHGLEKIKTIGDSYMCASGIPAENSMHAIDTVHAALEIQEFMLRANKLRTPQGKKLFRCRIGVHSGPVVAGIVGIKKFAYDIWGDTVNIASRMETIGEPGRVNISGSTYELIKDHFACSYRGKIDAKNKGLIDNYFVDSALKL